MDRVSCASLEEKAKVEYDKVNEGMEEFNKKMKEISDAKDEKTKKHKKIVKWVSFTVNFLKICCYHSKIWTMWLYHRVTSPNDADGMANSVDPDQTAPLGL